MKIQFIGYNHTHSCGFEINRPYGSGNYLLLLFRSPAFVELGGQVHQVQANSFILYSTGKPQHYGACGENYANDWIHFTLGQGEEGFFAAHGLPLDVPVWAGSLTEHSELVRSMCFEHNSSAQYREESLDLQLRLLLVKLSRSVSGKHISRAHVDDVRYYVMSQIRAMIFNTHPLLFAVDELAERASLSRSHFQHTYRKLFGVSVTEDMVASRVEYAKLLLATTDYTVKDIAEQCGYSSDVHFMRQFKARTGLTPTAYRNCF